MKKISVLLLFVFLFSCTPESRELPREGIRDITQKEFKDMIEDGEIDYVEASEKDVYVFLTDKAAQNRGVSEAPQFHFSINSYESFRNEMESLDREYLIHPVQ